MLLPHRAEGDVHTDSPIIITKHKSSNTPSSHHSASETDQPTINQSPLVLPIRGFFPGSESSSLTACPPFPNLQSNLATSVSHFPFSWDFLFDFEGYTSRANRPNTGWRSDGIKQTPN